MTAVLILKALPAGRPLPFAFYFYAPEALMEQ